MMIIKIGQTVSIECENKSLDVLILEIVKDTTDAGFKKSGIRLNSVDYNDINITNNEYNQNHIIVFEHLGTDFRWAYLYQIEGIKE